MNINTCKNEKFGVNHEEEIIEKLIFYESTFVSKKYSHNIILFFLHDNFWRQLLKSH